MVVWVAFSQRLHAVVHPSLDKLHWLLVDPLGRPEVLGLVVHHVPVGTKVRSYFRLGEEGTIA